MVVGEARGNATAWCALDETLHNQERLINFLDRARVFADGGGDGRKTDRTAAKLVDNRHENLVVNFVEAELVDVQGFQRDVGDASVDATRALHLCEVANTAQQGVGDSGRSA